MAFYTSMKLIHYKSAEKFLDDTLTFLEEREAANNLILGLTFGMKRGKYAVEGSLLFAIADGKRILFSALQTPGRNLTIFGEERAIPIAVSWLAQFSQENGHLIPGILGPQKLVTSFAQSWQIQTNTPWELHRNQRVFQLDQVADITYARGQFRQAQAKDQHIIAAWLIDFHLEAIQEDIRGSELSKAQQMINSKRLFVWEDKEIVSMAASTRATRHGITINAVFTPTAFRKKGYASSCVASLSQHLLTQGYQFCSLFTDAANPTSNKIYQNIGYYEVAKFQSITFALTSE